MKACFGLSLLLVLATAGLGVVSGSQQWTNREGKTITASFVRLSPGGNSVVLRLEGKIYEVEVSQLQPESQRQALTLQEKKAAWAAQEAKKSLFHEEDLVELVEFNPPVLVGKLFLARGRIAKILEPSSMSSSEPRIQLQGGTVSPMDFSSYKEAGLTKLKYTENQLLLLKLSEVPGLRSYKEMELLHTGQLVTIHVRVDKTGVVGLGAAELVEIRKAGNYPDSSSFQRYLEDWGMGFATDPLPSPAEPAPGSSSPLEATPQNTPPVSSNLLIQWLLSVLGQTEEKQNAAP